MLRLRRSVFAPNLRQKMYSAEIVACCLAWLAVVLAISWEYGRELAKKDEIIKNLKYALEVARADNRTLKARYDPEWKSGGCQ